jgi:hypothetical protein
LLGILLLISIFSKKIMLSRFKEVLKKNTLFAFLIMLFPAILYFEANIVYIIGSAILIYASILLGSAFLIPFIISLFEPDFSNEDIDIFSFSFIGSVMFLPMIRSWTFYSNVIPVDFLFLFVFATVIAKIVIRYKKLLTIFLLCCSIILILIVIKHKKDEKELTVNIPQDFLELKMQDAPNIFLFMHDAFPRKDLIKRYEKEYGIKRITAYESMEKVLNENGFVIYDIYSLGETTRRTMAMLFMFNDMNANRATYTTGGQRFEDLRNQTSGNNTVNIVLKNNGYATAIIYNSSYLFDPNLITKFYTKVWNFASDDSTFVIRGIMQGELDSSKVSRVSKDRKYVLSIMSDTKEKNKNFIWGQLGPAHSALGGNKDFNQDFFDWLRRYDRSVLNIKYEASIMAEKHPDAIIIFMSDHGPSLLGDHTRSYDAVPEDKIDEMFFRDKYGAFMAIRWPDKQKATKYDKEFYITQDLFAVVLSYLFDSTIPLKHKVQDTSVRIKSHKFDKGKFYPYFYGNENEK